MCIASLIYTWLKVMQVTAAAYTRACMQCGFDREVALAVQPVMTSAYKMDGKKRFGYAKLSEEVSLDSNK